jgi:hypothetical protein
LLAAPDVPSRLDLPANAAAPEIKNAAVAAIGEWRTMAANPMVNRLTAATCETAVRAAERIFGELAG